MHMRTVHTMASNVGKNNAFMEWKIGIILYERRKEKNITSNTFMSSMQSISIKETLHFNVIKCVNSHSEADTYSLTSSCWRSNNNNRGRNLFLSSNYDLPSCHRLTHMESKSSPQTPWIVFTTPDGPFSEQQWNFVRLALDFKHLGFATDVVYVLVEWQLLFVAAKAAPLCRPSFRQLLCEHPELNHSHHPRHFSNFLWSLKMSSFSRSARPLTPSVHRPKTGVSGVIKVK